MQQLNEKVKDIVEVCPNQTLHDFSADPTQTLAGYHFTDITAELMAKWVDRVVSLPAGSGNSFALAGYRGVGKSHFLAVFGAILSLPELRTRLKDSHVYASAERLIRRHYPVIHVRRGTKAELSDEIRSALSRHFNAELAAIGEAPAEIIDFAAEKAGAGPTIFIIDTATEREIRVARDDGPYLSELADAAAGKNVFIAVALDDDVAAADGRNSAIAQKYVIDYLDHEHLYKIVDVHIFPKVGAKRKTIFEIFESFRRLLPGFRWSEQRFSSVYPLHPVILEVAPFVRLFVQDFALLSFASEAGGKILGRPADSLIALDELFDRVEKDLRKSTELKDAFTAYDELNASVIANVPVLERLKAKLVVKGLMMLSLDGEGATASDIGASMLLFDESEPQSAVDFVEGLLSKLAATLPNGLWKLDREGRAAKYGFRLSGKEDFNSALAEAVRDVPETVVPGILMRLMRERFADCDFVDAGNGRQVVNTELIWRGAKRHGRVIWCIGENTIADGELPPEPLAWEAIISFDEPVVASRGGVPSVHWRPDELKLEESDTIRRYHTLMSRTDLQEMFRDQIRTAIQAQTIAIEKILDRKFLQYAKLVVDREELPFSPQACSGHTLSEVFSIMLAPYYERLFGSHPQFPSTLEMQDVDELASGVFAGEVPTPNAVRLGMDFAVPLGLAESDEGQISVVDQERITQLPPVSAVLSSLNAEGGKLSTFDIERCLGSAPFGLTLEAQRLILAALVGRNVVEFVTTGGDRIGRRSLDLRIIWDDIAGIASTTDAKESDEGLARWAVLLTGDQSLQSAGAKLDRDRIKNALSGWLEKWRAGNGLSDFNSLPENMINTRIWQLGSQVQKSFGPAAEAIESVVVGSTDVESGLRRIRDAFTASETEFESSSADLTELTDSLRLLPVRDGILLELSSVEPTDDPAIESLRHALESTLHRREFGTEELRQAQAMFAQFSKAICERFSTCHHEVIRSHDVRDRAEQVLRSNRWWVFENLLSIKEFPQSFRTESRLLLRELRSMNCTSQISPSSEGPGFCTCGFSLSRAKEIQRLPERLSALLDAAFAVYSEQLSGRSAGVSHALDDLHRSSGDATFEALAEDLSKGLTSKVDPSKLSDAQVRMLRFVLSRSADYSAETDFGDEVPPEAVKVAEEVTDEALLLSI